MKIVFNGKDCGFGDNGGSHTLVQSAKHLARLGADVTLFGLYKYTWDELPKGVRVVPHGKIPTCDVIVATGQSTVPSTLSHKRCTKRFWWVRGHEVWSTSEKQLNQYYSSIPCMANSEWLKEYIERVTKKKCLLQYQGVDFELWANEKPWEEREIQVGGLYSKRHKTKNHKLLEFLESPRGFSVKMLNRDLKNPTFEQQKDWYNNIKVWVSCSTLEGFHNPPVEAAMCGCALVAIHGFRGGTEDYTEETINCEKYHMAGDDVYQWDMEESIMRYLNNPELAVAHNKRLQESIKTKIGSREENMKKMLETFNE